ncbi:MAG: D-alanyl-D-alanine carboxypeptidase/D-alanyl-D-alanine-endopeptidase [Myxococcota bacterium]
MWWALVSLAVAGGLKKLVDEELDHPTLHGAVVSLRIDDERGKTLFARGSEQRLVPASTMKWVTAVAAADQLGLDHTFTTTVEVAGVLVGDTLYGDIYWVGDGDPSLGEDDPNEVLDEIARVMGGTGIRRVKGGVVVDHSIVTDPPLGAGWMWDDMRFGFSAPHSGLNLGHNLWHRAFKDVEGCESVDDRRDAPLIDPPTCFGNLLQARLVEAGIRTTKEPRAGDVPNDATEFVRFESPPMSDLLNRMLLDSDNLYAECIARALDPDGARSIGDAREVLDGLFERAKVTPTFFKLADGSGLSRYSLVSADTLVELTSWAVQQPWGLDLLELMPIAGVSGTMENRNVGTPAQGRVWAKTGSMSGVRNLVGVVQDAKDRNLRFAILFNGVAGQKAAREVQDRILTLLSISRRRRIPKADLELAFPNDE